MAGFGRFMNDRQYQICPAPSGTVDLASSFHKAPEGRGSKVCPRCDSHKPTCEFPSNKSRHDGLAAWCKWCNRQCNEKYRVTLVRTERPASGFKVCTRCQANKPVAEFSSDRMSSDGLRDWCKWCAVYGAKKWVANNRERVLSNAARWRAENKHKTVEYNRRAAAKIKASPQLLERSKKAKRAYHKKYYQKNKDAVNARISAYAAKRAAVDMSYRLSKSIRSRLCNALKRHLVRKTGKLKLLGCSLDECIKFLESQFEPWMNWGNWGIEGWSIDHIRPLHTFDLSDDEQLAEAAHFRNLRPMRHSDNIVLREYSEDRKALYAERLLEFPKEKPAQ